MKLMRGQTHVCLECPDKLMWLPSYSEIPGLQTCFLPNNSIFLIWGGNNLLLTDEILWAFSLRENDWSTIACPGLWLVDTWPVLLMFKVRLVIFQPDQEHSPARNIVHGSATGSVYPAQTVNKSWLILDQFIVGEFLIKFWRGKSTLRWCRCPSTLKLFTIPKHWSNYSNTRTILVPLSTTPCLSLILSRLKNNLTK